VIDTRTFYDRISRAYDVIADGSERACRDRGVELLDAKPGERVLELGFGTGHVLVALAAAVGSTGRVCGLDISSGMLTVARDRVAEAGLRNVVLTLGDARRLCFRDATFDAAFMSFTLELFDAEAITNVLGELRRVLRPGGRLGVVAMASNTSTNAMVEIYKWPSAFPALCRLPANRPARCARPCPVPHRVGGRHGDVGAAGRRRRVRG
jgi:ubiquinone/menaquinone biosynthesis C-methylase UbiE